MELKDYQIVVIDKLSAYLKVLKETKRNTLIMAESRKNRGLSVSWNSDNFNFCKRAWDNLNGRRLLPLLSAKSGNIISSYKSRFSGIGRPVPNVCLKVPTGGGKTLLGVGSVERINTDFFERNTGFILWVVPSESIYQQTLKALSNRDTLYRQILDRAGAGGGKVRILQKTDSFHPRDVESSLCVMLVMLQSAGRQSKETLRIFRDSGKFPLFFPEIDNYHANQKLLEVCPNLDTYSLEDCRFAGGLKKISLKQSLGNVLKLTQPVVVIDEGHRAYTEKAKNAIMDFNPRFILELSATPNKKEHKSNVLVSVSGAELKKEEMIKLPVNIFSLKNKDWKKTLAKGHEVLCGLSKDAIRLQKKEKRYIRPIQLIRVERTGRDQREKKFIHSEDVREYLIKSFNVDPAEIKIKSASQDELKNEDLLSEYSRVRYIITKEALKEGWDCPFAYILTILSKTKAPLAIEQMIGRVLRQADTQKTGMESLNQSYIICRDQDTAGVVEGIKKGLENEGMDGLGREDIKEPIKLKNNKSQKKVIKRRNPFGDLKIFLPKVLCKRGNNLKELSYEEDLLFNIDWSKLTLNEDLLLKEKVPDISYTQVDIKKQMDLISSFHRKEEETVFEDTDLANFNQDFSFMCQRLSDIVPNAWDASAIMDKVLSSLKRKHGKEKVCSNKFRILDFLRDNLQSQISREVEKIFKKKLKNHEFVFKLVSVGESDLNWKMAETLNLSLSQGGSVFRKTDDKDLQLSLFENVYKKEIKFKDLEKKVSWYLDEDSTIKWWHWIIKKRKDWFIQGLQKNKIYLDFLVCVKSSKNGKATFSILETK